MELFKSLLNSVKPFGRATFDPFDDRIDDNGEPSGFERIISLNRYNPLYFTMIYQDQKGTLFIMLIIFIKNAYNLFEINVHKLS